VSSQAEAVETFECFGSTCSVFVTGSGSLGSARDAVTFAKRELLSWHERFSRFLPDSELSRLNADPREVVPVSALMARLAQAVRIAGSLTGGLVDATLLEPIETAGYASDLPHALSLDSALELAPIRRPAGASAHPHWHQVQVDTAARTVSRPPGVKLDSGGLAKGLFADVLAEALVDHASFAIDCAGDLRIGGADGLIRAIYVESPFDASTLHTFELARTALATSGIGRRSWLSERGTPAHHLLDPSTGTPAYTGIVQATALAPSALMAEIHAKAALLSGPAQARASLPHGGVIVLDDGSHRVIQPPPTVTLGEISAYAA
jgi:thiamine biosynthesis lipoprotein